MWIDQAFDNILAAQNMYSKANENVNSRFGMLQNEGFKVSI